MNAIELAERLEIRARTSVEVNHRFGRRGPEWALEKELDWQAALLLRAQHAALKPFAQLAPEVDYLRHEDGSTDLHRLYARDIRRAARVYGGQVDEA